MSERRGSWFRGALPALVSLRGRFPSPRCGGLLDRGLLGITIAAATASAVAAAEPADAPGWRVELAGPLLPLPATLPVRDGGEARVTGVSGITWLGGDRYAAVMDNSRHLMTFAVEVDAAGQPRRITGGEIVPLPVPHDYEDLAAWPPPAPTAIDAAGVRMLLVAEEDTPAVRVCRWPEARLDGGLRLPKVFRGIRPNRGVEAVAADPDGEHVWAANEEALVPDGPGPTPTEGTVVRIVRLDVGPAGGAGGRQRQVGYAVAPPHPFVRLLDHPSYAGVVALVALGEGRLLVLERSGCPGLPPFTNRIEWIDTTAAPDVAALDGGLDRHRDRFVKKHLLWAGSVAANLEGLCLGPPLGAGRLLLGVTDDGGIALPSALVGFRLLPAAGEPTGAAGEKSSAASGPAAAPLTSP